MLLVLLFVVSLPAVTPRIYSSDEVQYFAYLRSLWFDHDLSFENEYRYFYDRGIARSEGFRETFLELETDTHHRINFGTIGCAILWSPFYGAGDLVARATGATRDGFSKPYVAAVAYGSAVYGFLAVVLAIRCAGRLGFNGFAAGLAVWFGTPLLFYMYVAPPFSHACSAFGVALFTWVWLHVRDDRSPRGMLALGAAAALMVMVREQDLFFIAGPAVDFAWSAVNAKGQMPNAKRVLASATAGILSFVIVFAPQAATYLVLNGHLGPHASVSNKMSWTAPHALQVLFSPEHGLFIWTPLAAICLAGLVTLLLPPNQPPPRLRRSAEALCEGGRWKRQVAICLLVMVAFQVYIGGSVESWTVAGGFGQRRFIALTTALVIGYGAVRPASRGAAALWTAITVLCVYWNLALTAEFATGLMDRQRLEPQKNAYDAFVTLPRMAPSLAYRYLFERSSFYKHGS